VFPEPLMRLSIMAVFINDGVQRTNEQLLQSLMSFLSSR
jgi:hypothetical protein